MGGGGIDRVGVGSGRTDLSAVQLRVDGAVVVACAIFSIRWICIAPVFGIGTIAVEFVAKFCPIRAGQIALSLRSARSRSRSHRDIPRACAGDLVRGGAANLRAGIGAEVQRATDGESASLRTGRMSA